MYLVEISIRDVDLLDIGSFYLSVFPSKIIIIEILVVGGRTPVSTGKSIREIAVCESLIQRMGKSCFVNDAVDVKETLKKHCRTMHQHQICQEFAPTGTRGQ